MSTIPHFFDFTALGILLAAIFLVSLIIKQFPHSDEPLFYFSETAPLRSTRAGLAAYAHLPRYLLGASLLFFSLAFIDPHLEKARVLPAPAAPMPQQGIAIYLVLDRSGSMNGSVPARTADGRTMMVPKIELLKIFTEQFVKDRPNDLIGIVAFARTPQVLAPLTLDHTAILDQLANFHTVQTPTEDGTALGYAIFKTAHLIAATRHFAEEYNTQQINSYEIKDAIMITVTDGFQDPSALDKGNRLRTIELEEAADYAKSERIRLYVANVDSKMTSAEFAPQRRLMQKITEATGGHFFTVDEGNDLSQVFTDINKLEKSTIAAVEPGVNITTRSFSLYPALILLGICCLLASIVLDTTLLRKAP